MAVNYGLLQAIQPPQQIATLPVTPSQGDNIMGGIMQGLDQGQIMQARALQMQQTKQQMEQSRQLFPGQQQIQQQTIQQNQMMNQQKAQEMQDQADLRAASAAGPDAYLEYLMKTDQNAAVVYQSNQMDYQNKLLQNKGNILTLNEKEREKADRDNSINVAVMNQVSQMPPQLADQEYQKYRADLLKKYPDLVMPEKFDADSFASVMRTNQIMQAQQQEQATEKVSTLTQLQKQRENLEANKRQLEESGRPTAEINRKINEVNDLIQTHTKNRQTVTTLSDEKSKYVAQEEAKMLPDIRQSRSDIDDQVAALDETLASLEKTPEQLLGPVQKWFGIASLTKEGQVLTGKVNKLVLKDKNAEKMGSQGYTDKDRQIQETIVGGLNNYKGSMKELMEYAKRLAEIKRAGAWLRENEVMEGTDGYDKWLNNNPEPSVKIIYNGKVGNVKASRAKAYINNGAKYYDGR